MATELVLLVAAFAVRGALAWGFEVAGRRAAATVLSELRLALVARRLSAQPAALDGTEGAEVAVLGVNVTMLLIGGTVTLAAQRRLAPLRGPAGAGSPGAGPAGDAARGDRAVAPAPR